MTAELLAFPVQPARRPRPAALHVVAAHRENDRAELVSALLLTMENAPLAPALCYPVRDIAQRAHVVVTIDDTVFRLQPDDCRTAARALDDEQAFAGCSGVAADLREAAAVAEARQGRGGPLNPAPSSRRRPGRTGMASTLALAALALIVAAVDLIGRSV